jgi:hypothetical protein
MVSGGLKTRLAVLEAKVELRAQFQETALSLVKEDLERRLHDMNGWRAEEIANHVLYLRAETYDKSENLHRIERETANNRIATLEIRITQVATIGAIAVLAATIGSPFLYHFLFPH